jgi:hypothetical protein
MLVTLVTAVAGHAGEDGKPFTTYTGLIRQQAVDKLDRPSQLKVVSSTFVVGVLSDGPAYQAFARAAGLPAAPDIDWNRHALVYVILRDNTNRVRLEQWSIGPDGTGLLQFHWDGIEPYYHGAFPALLHKVDKKGLKQVVVQLVGTPRPSVEIPISSAQSSEQQTKDRHAYVLPRIVRVEGELGYDDGIGPHIPEFGVWVGPFLQAGPQWYGLDFGKSKELQETAKRLYGKKVVVEGIPQVRTLPGFITRQINVILVTNLRAAASQCVANRTHEPRQDPAVLDMVTVIPGLAS